MQNKIGILVDNLHMDIDIAIQKAAEIGADGFQVFCTRGKMAPENLDAAGRKRFLAEVKALELEIPALCGDMGKGFLDAEANKEIVPRMKTFVDLAVDLGVKVVSSHIGRLPDDENDPSWAIGLEAFADLGAYAESRGCVIAMETGPEEPMVLKRFLDKIDNKGIGVNYDPANLAMQGFDHIGGVFLLKDYIVHTHAKDAVRLFGLLSAEGNRAMTRPLEVPLGQGSVAFPYYIWALQRIGYKGYLTVEREAGPNPLGDMAAAVNFLRGVEVWDGMRYNRAEDKQVPFDMPV